MRDKYVKEEGRVIHYHGAVKLYFVQNLVMHLAFLVMCIISCLAANGNIAGQITDGMSKGYYLLWFINILLVSLLDEFQHRQFWKKKRRIR